MPSNVDRTSIGDPRERREPGADWYRRCHRYLFQPLMYFMRGIAPHLVRSVLPPLPLYSRLSAPRLAHAFSSYSRLNMDANVKQHYLADSPPTVVRLEVKSHFDTLEDQNLRKYAHFMSRYG